jgi:hypothetical protein
MVGNPFFDPEPIKNSMIDLMELDGKQLVIKVLKNEGLVTVAGFDGGKVYIILQEYETK